MRNLSGAVVLRQALARCMRGRMSAAEDCRSDLWMQREGAAEASLDPLRPYDA